MIIVLQLVITLVDNSIQSLIIKRVPLQIKTVIEKLLSVDFKKKSWGLYSTSN